MRDELSLTGQRILVAEDDYYLATDTAQILRKAGAEILGPCPSEESAMSAMSAGLPTAAVLDINLGQGPSFKLAHLLRRRGIPFVFVTGYDATRIPAEFETVHRLQKPVELRQIVSLLAEALQATA